MLKLKITLSRSAALRQYGPTEEEVLGAYDIVELNYDLLRVDGEEVGFYDDDIGAWCVQINEHKLMFSDILIEPMEG